MKVKDYERIVRVRGGLKMKIVRVRVVRGL